MGINAQVTELREALTEQKTAVSEAAQRVLDLVASLEAKVAELGEVDPDLQADIDEIRSETEAIIGPCGSCYRMRPWDRPSIGTGYLARADQALQLLLLLCLRPRHA